MNRQSLIDMVSKYEQEFDPHSYQKYIVDTQYDDRSALLNYAFVRENKPKVVVEFGTRYGRCTFDIMTALIKNGDDFIYKPYELEDLNRSHAQKSLNEAFKDKSPIIGGDILNATDLPKDIDYLFIDNYHDRLTTEWVFDTLLPTYCKDGCIVSIHDLPIEGEDWKNNRDFLAETDYMFELHQAGKLPLEKIYWTWEEGDRWESTWWTYRK